MVQVKAVPVTEGVSSELHDRSLVASVPGIVQVRVLPSFTVVCSPS